MAIGIVVCTVCNGEFNGSSNSMYCSNKCKQASYRHAKSLGGFIYKLMDGKEVVYVGQSINMECLEGRVLAHSCGGESKKFDSYSFYRVVGSNLNETEAKEIITHEPKYNKRLPKNKTYITVKQLSVGLVDVFEEFIISQCATATITGDLGVKKHYLEESRSEEFIIEMKKILTNKSNDRGESNNEKEE
tara:strand:+ start:63 stop:629 length:567 start_codon:yes stop_codon:yes gene_type:complete